MIDNVFDADELRDMTATLAGASLAELEQMKSCLREVKQMIYREIASRSGDTQVAIVPQDVRVLTVSAKSVGGTVQRVCANLGCTVVYKARSADIKRGWGLCCSKSCAASHRLRSNPDHGYLTRGDSDTRDKDAVEEGWDGHKMWSGRYG